VSAAGGTPEVLTRPDHAQGEVGHFWPEILPGGRAVLFTITSQSQTGGIETNQVAVRDLRTGAQKVLLRGGSHGHYAASGHLVYVAGGTLRAIAFDLNRLETHGTSVPVVQRLAIKDSGTADFDVATDGTLVYVDAASVSRRTRARSSGSIGMARSSPSPPSPTLTYSRASRPTAPASRSSASTSRKTSGSGTSDGPGSCA
jgi:serine/threonine-protein kinase